MPSPASHPVPLLDRHLGRGRLGVERVGSGATLVLVVVLGGLLAATAALSALVVTPNALESVPAGKAIELSGVADVGVEVPAGWRVDTSTSSSTSLTLVRPGLRVTVAPTTSEVRDIDVYFERTVRALAIEGLRGRTVDVRSSGGNPAAVTGVVEGRTSDAFVATIVGRSSDGSGPGITVIGVTPSSTAEQSARHFEALLQEVRFL